MVRRALSALPTRFHADACEAILALEKEHGPRRRWVWARLGLAPMAEVLEPLARLAEAARTSLGGSTPDDLAAAYRERGWQADAAAGEAIAMAPTAGEARVAAAVRHLLAPWLEDSARAFQAALERAPLPGRDEQPPVKVGDEVCILFADGLRFDLGQRLAERLEGRGCRAAVRWRWAALPTVTPTAGAAVTPAAGEALGEDFEPRIRTTGEAASVQNLRASLEALGYQILGLGSLDVPLASPARGWVEAGEIDSLGHKLQVRLARQIPAELDRLATRIVALLEAGWKAVRVVTDHGWLLLPGGLPKVDLPRHLTASRWARCAVIAGEARPAAPRAPWHWNPS